MNKCNEDFIKRINIDFSLIDTKIYDVYDVNEIVGKYEIQGETIDKEVSLDSIVGIHSMDHIPDTFPEVLDSFFDALGDGYHSRAVSMLQYDENNVIEGLTPSFAREPIVLIEVDNNKFLILTNGMHRFITMRMLYLSAKSKCQTNEEINALIKKYTIPVKVVKVDMIKTYCKYIINLFQDISCMDDYFVDIETIKDANNNEAYRLTKEISFGNYRRIYLTKDEMDMMNECYHHLSCEYDNDFKQTGRSVLKKFNGDVQTLTDDELIMLTKEVILKSHKPKDKIYATLRTKLENYKSFNSFVNQYFPELLNYTKEEIKDDDNIKRSL